jgi:hypothetical protein
MFLAPQTNDREKSRRAGFSVRTFVPSFKFRTSNIERLCRSDPATLPDRMNDSIVAARWEKAQKRLKTVQSRLKTCLTRLKLPFSEKRRE